MIAVLTDGGIGGTFLTWSLHYLAGHDNYFLADQNSFIDLPVDPLNDTNAHKFRSNHPVTAEKFTKIFNTLITTPTDTFHTIYFHNFKHSVESSDSWLAESIDRLTKHAKKIIVVQNLYSLYNCSYSRRAGGGHLWHDPDAYVKDFDKIFEDFTEYFFKESTTKWSQLGLNSVWDRREFIALNFNFDKIIQITPNIDLSIEHYCVDIMDLLNTFDISIKQLFEYLDLTVDSARWQHWVTIYTKWKKIHYDRLQFVWYFDTIINGIINGHSLDLTRFNLDIMQEAAIQHTLIYKHNLNLKTWQLEKFQNTKQLHQLLEINIHNTSGNFTDSVLGVVA